MPDPPESEPSAVSTEPTPRTAAQLAKLLGELVRTGPPRVGVELELGLLRADGLGPIEYPGAGGVGALLERLAREGPWATPVFEDGRTIALKGEEGESVTLEPGGQLELASPPRSSLVELRDLLADRLARLAQVADELGIVVVAGSMVPVDPEAAPWMPKARYRIMRAHFEGLGAAGRLHRTMMQRTTSVQVTVDYADADDASELLRLAFLCAPVATAIFANSPLTSEGVLSARAEAWLAVDPARCGEVPAAVAPGATLLDYVDYALDVPMMFRVRGHEHLPMQGASFREVFEAGRWADGDPLTLDDVVTHLGSLFPDARLKPRLIELRSTDGQPPSEAMTVAAFWTGLLYDAPARRELFELLGGLEPAARDEVRRAVPRLGLRARWGDTTLLDLGRAVVALARAGLERRVERGEEPPEVVELLAPVERRLAAGRTPADELLELWNGEWRRSREALIEALRVRA